MRLKKGPPDFVLFITTLALLGVGLIMVFSSSAVTANIEYGDAYYFFKKQLMWALIGVIAMIIVMKLNFNRLKEFIIPLMVIVLVCLVLVLTPVGIEVKGSSRWLGVSPLIIQPSELAKLVMVMFIARSLDNNQDRITSFSRGVLPNLVVLAVICGLILKQPDLGTSVTLAGTIICMMFMAGVKISHLSVIAGSGIAAVVAAIAVAPYRMERVVAYWNPFKFAKDEGYQTVQSLYALGSGGLFGMGLGRSRQKFFYLPEKHTDFIFAILGEELGFIGAFLVLTLFCLFAWRGYKIAMNAPDNFTRILAAGLTTLVILQAIINIGVVSGALPVTGITLPFVSYGGNSLLFSMAGVGLLLNISRYSSYR